MTLDDITLNLVLNPKHPKSKDLIKIFEEYFQGPEDAMIMEVEGVPVYLEDLIRSLVTQFTALPKHLKVPGSKKGLFEMHIKEVLLFRGDPGIIKTHKMLQVLLSFLGYEVGGYKPQRICLNTKDGEVELAALRDCGRQKILVEILGD